MSFAKFYIIVNVSIMFSSLYGIFVFSDDFVIINNTMMMFLEILFIIWGLFIIFSPFYLFLFVDTPFGDRSFNRFLLYFYLASQVSITVVYIYIILLS